MINKKLLRAEESGIRAFLRRYNPDQVRGSRTKVLLSAGFWLPVLIL
jgi:hypothetical protein